VRSDAAVYLSGILAEQGHGAEAVPPLEQAASNAGASGVLFGVLSLACAALRARADSPRASRQVVGHRQAKTRAQNRHDVTFDLLDVIIKGS
jgi:hypothetical protein